jgi:hypothetical protein
MLENQTFFLSVSPLRETRGELPLRANENDEVLSFVIPAKAGIQPRRGAGKPGFRPAPE